MPSLILVFDFDRTVLSNEGDSAVLQHLGQYERLRDLYDNQKMQWTKIMDTIFSEYTKEQLASAVEASFKVDQGMIDLMNYVADLQDKTKPLPTNVTDIFLVLCTDSNSFFVEHAFKVFFPRTRIDLLYTNPATFDPETRKMRVSWCEPNGHNCRRCNTAGLPNMCKGNLIERLMVKPPTPDPVLYFFGDGFNDLCALTRLPASGTCFVRRGYSLHKELLAPLVDEKVTVVVKSEDNSNSECADPASGGSAATMTTSTGGTPPPLSPASPTDGGIHDFPPDVHCRTWRGICRLLPWTDGNDLFPLVLSHVQQTLCDLPPLHLFGDGEDPRNNTFRGYSQAVRVPGCLRQAIAVAPQLQIDSRNGNQQDEDIVAARKAKAAAVAALADAVEHDDFVDDACLQEWCFSESITSPVRRKWSQMPWLHGEMLLHRRLNTIIRGSVSPQLLTPETDFWAACKKEATEHAMPWLESIVGKMQQLWDPQCNNSSDNNVDASNNDDASIKRALKDLFMFELQGNVADLCFRASSDLAQMFEPQLVRDDRDAVVDYLVDQVANKVAAAAAVPVIPSFKSSLTANAADARQQQQNLFLCDIVIDNAGPELSADLLFAACFINYVEKKVQQQQLKAATPSTSTPTSPSHHRGIRLLVKDMPFYVSDAVPHDVDAIIERFASCSTSSPILQRFAAVLKDLRSRDLLHVVIAPFGTKIGEMRDLGFDSVIFGSRVPRPGATTKTEWTAEQQPFVFLPRTHLVIVKGDLNFRRVTGDRHWSPSTPFSRTLQESVFRHLPTVCVRTLKCEVLVGVREERVKELDESAGVDPVKGWRVNGQRGVILFGGVPLQK